MKIRKWLFEANMKVSELAKRLDTHPSYVFQLMSGRRSPSPKFLLKIQEITLDMVQTKEDMIDETRVKCVKRRTKIKVGAKSGAKKSMPVRVGSLTMPGTYSGKKNRAI